MAPAAKAKTLPEALAAFQADLPEIGLDAENPHFRSKFASLANITKETFPKLAEQGLSFSMGSFVNEHGVLVLDAHLMHETGESRSMQIPTTENNPQKLGSFFSYMRRYSLSSLTGVVADEDDDGNAATQQAPKALQKAEERKQNPPKQAAPRAKATPTQSKIATEFIESKKLTREQVLAVTDRIKLEKGLSGEGLFAEVYKALSNGEVG